MYCRRCHYNLYGLPQNRCPECGTPFDPSDETTYWPRPPTLRDRFRVSPLRRWVILAGLVVIVCLHAWIPSVLGRRYPSYYHYDRTNAQSVMANNLCEVLGCWRKQKDEAGSPGDLDVRKAKSQVRPGLSPRSDAISYYGRKYCASSIEYHAWDIFFASVYMGYMALFGSGRARKWFAITAAILLLASALAPDARHLPDNLPWPRRGYVYDFIYVQGLDWSQQEDRGEQIIAYEKCPWGFSKKRRVVAFADWCVHLVPEHIFQRLAAEQGIPLR